MIEARTVRDYLAPFLEGGGPERPGVYDHNWIMWRKRVEVLP